MIKVKLEVAEHHIKLSELLLVTGDTISIDG